MIDILKYLSSNNIPNDIINKLSESLNDQIYLYAKNINLETNEIHLDPNDMIVFSNAKNKNKALTIFNHSLFKNAPLVSDIRDKKREGILLSVGAIVYSADNYLLSLERDEMAPSYPLTWHFPAGRSDLFNGYINALKELEEEVLIRDYRDELVDMSQYIAKSHSNYKEIKMYFGTEVILNYLTHPIMDFNDNTLEQQTYFYLPNNKDFYKLEDNEYNRNVEFKTLDNLKSCNLAGNMKFILPNI